ncbi:MAG: hypothetical protein LBL63_02515, partial [Clostridiales Family XIII bacterium]|jgi:hypothetical protein|nr:hypothetical protein [Clostridiales Family XIII bacterium]
LIDLPPTVSNYSNTPGFEDVPVKFTVQGASVLDGYPGTSKMTLDLYEITVVGGGTGTEYIGSTDLPVTESTANYETTFSALHANTTYYFTISGEMAGTTVPFYDASTEQTGRQYRFTTAKSLQIGNPSSSKSFTVAYKADAYNDKYLAVDYTLSGPSRGFEIWYDVVKTREADGTDIPDGQRRTESFKEALTVFFTDGKLNYGKIPIAAQSDAGALAGFWAYGATYEITIRAASGAMNLGESGSETYTTPIPRQPQFIVTATPDGTATPGSYETFPMVFRITPSDPDSVITESQYMVRVLNGASEDLTPADIATTVYTFGQTANRQQTVTVPNLQEADGYTLQIYAVDDRNYEGGSDYPPIDTIITPGVELGDGDIVRRIVRSVQFDVFKASSLRIGDITVSPLESVTQLIFENEQNLGEEAKFIKYSITKADGGELPISSEILSFALTSSGSGADAYKYYNLPTSIRDKDAGLYLIELRFIGPDRVTVVGQKTVSFRKMS